MYFFPSVPISTTNSVLAPLSIQNCTWPSTENEGHGAVPAANTEKCLSIF